MEHEHVRSLECKDSLPTRWQIHNPPTKYTGASMWRVPLPRAISMALVWPSGGERILGGLSVNGAAGKTNGEKTFQNSKAKP